LGLFMFRLFLIVCFFCCSLVSASSLAQNLDAGGVASTSGDMEDTSSSPSVDSPKSNAAQPNKSPPSSKSDFSKATDLQIEEAQNFYKSCKKNEDLSSVHDCRCLAGEYLASRMALGEGASSREVFSKVKALCIKDSENGEALSPDESTGTSEYTDEQIDEAQDVYEMCRKHSVMSVKHDCRCMASEFIQLRKEKGRLVDQLELLVYIRGKCYNGTSVAGSIYSDCISNPDMLPPLVKNAKAFCECYANEYAKAYEDRKTEMYISDAKNLALVLMGSCQHKQREFSLN